MQQVSGLQCTGAKLEVVSRLQFMAFGGLGGGAGVKHGVVGCSMVRMGKNVANHAKFPQFLTVKSELCMRCAQAPPNDDFSEPRRRTDSKNPIFFFFFFFFFR